MSKTADAPASVQPGFSFEQVIAPLTKAEFFEKYYEKEGLIVQRNDPEHFASLLTLDQIDEFITTSSPNAAHVAMANAVSEVTSADFTGPDNLIDAAKLYQQFNDGSTIILPGLQRKIPALAALCRAVEQEFDAQLQTNIYLSPPNAQGFKTHYDTHDVFVLQVAGSKEWRSYDVPVELPLIGQKFDSSKYTEIPPVKEFRLNAGDLYYCPRGLVHDARSTDDISLHITFGLMAKTWTEVMVEAVTAACVADPAFRENLPRGFASDPDFDRDAARAKFQDLLASIGDHVDFDALLDNLGSSFVTDRKPMLRGQMHQMMQLSKVDTDTRIMTRPNLIYTVSTADEEVTVASGQTVLTLPDHVEPILKDMLACAEPKALSAFDGDLDADGRVVLAKRLIREGLILAADHQNG